MEGRTAPPLEPRVNTEIRRPTRAAKLEPEHTTGCKSRSASGTPPDCSGETCSLSEETKAPQRQQLVPPTTRHDTVEEACHTPVGRAKQWGCPLSSVRSTRTSLSLRVCYGLVCYGRASRRSFDGSTDRRIQINLPRIERYAIPPTSLASPPTFLASPVRAHQRSGMLLAAYRA